MIEQLVGKIDVVWTENRFRAEFYEFERLAWNSYRKGRMSLGDYLASVGRYQQQYRNSLSMLSEVTQGKKAVEIIKRYK